MRLWAVISIIRAFHRPVGLAFSIDDHYTTGVERNHEHRLSRHNTTLRGRAGPSPAHADLPLLATTNVGQRVHMGGGSRSSSLGIFLVSYRSMREFPAVVVIHGLDMHAHCLGVTVAKAGKASLQYSTTPPGAGTIAIVVHEMRFARRLPSPECGGGSSVTAHLRIVARDQ
jgi:hypothetical protein